MDVLFLAQRVFFTAVSMQGYGTPTEAALLVPPQ